MGRPAPGSRGSRVAVDPIFLMYAFRYALGRMTYAVGDVADALVEHREELRPDWRAQITRDIREAVDAQRAGHACDVERWLRVAECFEAMACDHDWVSVRNDAVESGEVCTKCRSIRAEVAGG